MRALVALLLVLAVPTFAAADPGDCEGVHVHSQGETVHCGPPTNGTCNVGVVGNTNETVDRPCDMDLCQKQSFATFGGISCFHTTGPNNQTQRETLVVIKLGHSSPPIPSGTLYFWCTEDQSDAGSSSACHVMWVPENSGGIEAGENVPYPFATP